MPHLDPLPEPVGPEADIWGTDLHPAGCDACKQAHLVAVEQVGQPCPHCVRGTLAPQPARLRSEPPEMIVPFGLQKQRLQTGLEEFTRIRFQPDDFTPQQLIKRLTPVFWPMWLVDSDVVGVWQAEMGYDYQVKSTQESYGGGDWHSKEVVKTRIRWEPRTGQLIRHYDNVTVPALSDHNVMTNLLGKYDLKAARPYEASHLAASRDKPAALQIPSLHPENVWGLAQPRLDRSAGGECQQAAGAQHVRDFSIEAEYDSLNWTQLLLPMYVTWYTDDDGQRHPVYINGQTGKVGGIRLASRRKGWVWAGGLGAAAVALFVVGLILTLAAALFPPTAILGVPAMAISFFVAVAALYPMIQPWHWNKTRQAEYARLTGQGRD